MTRTKIEIAVGILLLTSAPAVAAEYETVSRTVSTVGLDLSKPADLATAQKRIKRAAWTICKPNDMFGPLSAELAARRCAKDAIAAAQPQLDRAVLIASARRRSTDSVALASRR